MKNRLFSNRQLVALIIPLVIEQGLTILVGMCDGVMVSSVGEAAISGVSLVDMINAVILVLFAALATGGAVVTSQLLGARQTEKARKSAGQLVTLAASMGLVMMALCLIFARGLLRLFFGSIDQAVMDAGLIYLRITALSFPFIALYNAGAAIFRSVGNGISLHIQSCRMLKLRPYLLVQHFTICHYCTAACHWSNVNMTLVFLALCRF